MEADLLHGLLLVEEIIGASKAQQQWNPAIRPRLIVGIKEHGPQRVSLRLLFFLLIFLCRHKTISLVNTVTWQGALTFFLALFFLLLLSQSLIFVILLRFLVLIVLLARFSVLIFFAFEELFEAFRAIPTFLAVLILF